MKTHNERRALLFIRLRKHEHRLQDLDAGLSIDIDALLVCGTVDSKIISKCQEIT
jgi:hypothetical protein